MPSLSRSAFQRSKYLSTFFITYLLICLPSCPLPFALILSVLYKQSNTKWSSLKYSIFICRISAFLMPEYAAIATAQAFSYSLRSTRVFIKSSTCSSEKIVFSLIASFTGDSIFFIIGLKFSYPSSSSRIFSINKLIELRVDLTLLTRRGDQCHSFIA